MKLRFAPNLQGPVQIGSARIALANWLLARRDGGRFILRLEDADPLRPGGADAAEQDLAWLGLDWDEVQRQSERLDRTARAVDRLKAAGRLYPCFESEEELAAKRDQRQRRNLATIYDRAMLKLTPEQRAKAEAGGKRPYWRFLLSPGAVEWQDLVAGRQQVKLSALGDPVLIRADGHVLPPLAAAIDDLDAGITHIVRTEEQLTATGIQLDIRAALGARPGTLRLAHLPPLTETAVGKRTGAITLRSLRQDGIEPAALAGTLARLGTPDPAVAEPPALLAQRFDLGRIGRTPPRFDPRSLLALNRQALQSLPFDTVRDRLPPAATPAFWLAVRGHLDLLREARGWWDVTAGSIVPPLLDGQTDYLHQALEALPPEPWNATTWPDWTSAVRRATGRKGKALFLPLRQALTGEDQGPELADLLPLMGRARVAERLALAAA